MQAKRVAGSERRLQKPIPELTRIDAEQASYGSMPVAVFGLYASAQEPVRCMLDGVQVQLTACERAVPFGLHTGLLDAAFF